MTLLWVGLGGFLGANARYLLGRAVLERYGAAFPWGTLAINLTGAFLIGVIAELLLLRQDDNPAWRLFLIVGVLGGYTTFSSYALEVVTLLRDDKLFRAMAYLLVSNVAGVALCFLGVALARRVV
ncbi:MAG: fluoride efflux transporter CrcB [Thermomicrobiales bacterium]|nr:fluoride efflux transporter CrcB [Thermomicrobiales bacterium]